MSETTKNMVSLLCEPKTLQSLDYIVTSQGSQFLVNPVTGIRYPIIKDIVRMLDQDDVTLRNKRYQELYDRFARGYDLSQRFSAWWSKKKATFELFAHELGIKHGDKVLEVSIGTGANFEFVSRNVQCYGLDISLGMLKRCAVTMKQTQRQAVITHGMAEALPFKDASFDVVFHIGGINFFNNRALAIQEMIRVAKPGTHFLIADETEEIAKKAEHWPIAKWFFKNRDETIVPPVDLVPKHMRDIRLRFVDDKRLYVLTFTKP